MAHAPIFFLVTYEESEGTAILTRKKVVMSSYFRSRARKGPGTEEQGSPVAGPVCDRSSPGQDRRRLQHGRF